MRRFLRSYWPWILLPALILGLLALAAELTAEPGDAPGTYAIQ